ADNHKTAGFAQWLLHIGNGEIGIPDDSDPENTSWVNILDEYCIPNDDNGITNLINFVYDDDTLQYPSAQKLQEKAIIGPKNDMRACFTSDVIIYKISTQNKWYCEKCASCRHQVIPGDPTPVCKNHGPQPNLTYRKYLSYVLQQSCNSLIKDCTELLAELPDKNPYQLPSTLKELEAPPVEDTTPKPVPTELPNTVILTDTFSPTLSRNASNEFNPEQTITTPSQQSPTRLSQPEHPMRDQEKKEHDVQTSHSTPPQLENPTEAHKANQQSNLIRPSNRKTLFKDTPETESLEIWEFGKFLDPPDEVDYDVKFRWKIECGCRCSCVVPLIRLS
nr:DNA helicase [Tanacetum cinerariifolium]